jgi:hypothetical protein
MGSQAIEVHMVRGLHFDPRRLGPRCGLSIAKPAMRAGKLVAHDLAVVLARPELCDCAPSLGRFLVLGLVAVITYMHDGLRGVPLAVAELCIWEWSRSAQRVLPRVE